MGDPWESFDVRRQPTQLGCGTLILIALIVMICSGGRSDDRLREDIRELRSEVRRLREAIEAQGRGFDGPSRAADAVAPR